jgi:hypothetical protein
MASRACQRAAGAERLGLDEYTTRAPSRWPSSIALRMASAP